jgi:DNA polymerase
LVQQIEILRPPVIATLGRFAMDFILDLFHLPQVGEKISQLHGKVIEAETSYGKAAIVPLFHPAVALYNREQRSTLEKDFQTLKQVIKS